MTKIIDEKKQPILPRLQAMKVGDSINFSVSRLNSVKTMCSNFGLQWGVKFKTHVRASEGIIAVTRIY